jgi:hypothetical protein
MADDAKKIVPFPVIRNALIPQAYDIAVTDFALKFNGRRTNADGSQVPQTREGPIRSNPVPFTLIANAPAIIIASQNAYRKGLMIQNKDLVDVLYVGFGSLADIRSFQVAPLGGTTLLDFVCPTDTISVFATANISGFYVDFAPIGE